MTQPALLAVLHIDGKAVCSGKLTADENGELSFRDFFDYEGQPQKITVSVGTEFELLETLTLQPVQFKTGKSGFATRARTKYQGQTWHLRANATETVPGGWGITIAARPSESRQVDVPAAWGAKQQTTPKVRRSQKPKQKTDFLDDVERPLLIDVQRAQMGGKR